MGNCIGNSKVAPEIADNTAEIKALRAECLKATKKLNGFKTLEADFREQLKFRKIEIRQLRSELSEAVAAKEKADAERVLIDKIGRH